MLTPNLCREPTGHTMQVGQLTVFPWDVSNMGRQQKETNIMCTWSQEDKDHQQKDAAVAADDDDEN